MVIEEVSVDNYRNLTGQRIKLCPNMSFIVGENNLGKSNLLDFLFATFNRSTLPEEDFRDPLSPITALLKVRFGEEEVGLLGDFSDVDDARSLTVRMVVESPDSEILFIHEHSGEKIPGKYIRRMSLFRYTSIRSDVSDLNFGKDRGVGKVLTWGLSIYQQRNGLSTLDFLNEDELNKLMRYLNDTFGSLPILGDYGMHVSVDLSDPDAMGSVITLADSNDLHFKRVGSGVQYVAILMLSIVEGLIKMGERRLSEAIVADEDGRKCFSCIITLDEPEAHLHPYMQRRLIKALSRMSTGADEGFTKLLKELFDIDAFAAQVVVVTHSPSILRRSYEELVRFYDSGQGEVKVANGLDVKLGFASGKHFADRFEFVREAFFVKRVLLVEGPSEAAALPRFAETLGIDVDEHGVLVLQVGSNTSIQPARDLLNEFEVETMSLKDRDGGQPVPEGLARTTNARDFEEEVVDALINSGQQDVFLALLRQYGVEPERLIVNRDSLRKWASKIGLSSFDTNIRLSSLMENGTLIASDALKAVMYTWLSKEKSGVLGAMIGAMVPLNCIPECYRLALTSMASEKTFAQEGLL